MVFGVLIEGLLIGFEAYWAIGAARPEHVLLYPLGGGRKTEDGELPVLWSCDVRRTRRMERGVLDRGG
ncbi:MAG: hypothetical protein CL933_10155 [Deltaproteobacteria bacterium]|nr:hypothetical protein [Deltaproteobacteria bacterium]